jgi:hypothetical protein
MLLPPLKLSIELLSPSIQTRDIVPRPHSKHIMSWVTAVFEFVFCQLISITFLENCHERRLEKLLCSRTCPATITCVESGSHIRLRYIKRPVMRLSQILQPLRSHQRLAQDYEGHNL